MLKSIQNKSTDVEVIDIITHLFFFLLIILAVFYREERLMADASYYFFRVVNNESFWVEHDRYILILSQVAPWIGSNLGLKMETVVLISSIGHVLFFYSLYLITRYVFNDVYAGLILLSIQFLGISSGFFVPIFEFYYAMGLLVLFYVIFNNSKHKFRHFILIILAFFIITAHFYAIILLVYTLLIYAFEKKDFKIKKYLPYIIMIVLFIVLKPFVISDYEKAKSADFLSSLSNNVYDFKYLKSWLSYIAINYWDWALLVFSTITVMILKRKYMLLLGYTLFLIGLIIMVNVSSYGFGLSRYKEQVNFSLMFISGFTFVYCISLFSTNFYKYTLLGLISVVFMFRFYSIWDTGKQFTYRLDEMKNIIDISQERDGTKFIVNQEKLMYDANWSYPVESLIFSSIHNEKCVSIVIDDDYYFSNNNNIIKPTEYMFRRWEIYDLSNLNANYFNLDESEYTRIEIRE
ncbi:hypothetical protein ERX46_08460 [Brumimicrobium glaciale]|uniref:Glycosyltransferase RgtA/B/C/D-like domain-containing protein n=1 Tax=Brumimicrobium glaciale TaxID=200475 RepID=A0A4Q4KLP3_9FLAO|nr:hypothetical protein [Brumimicrobium glaciale]RYM33988.1 hypothetical protein ERX46_08460 [Brumimicrobium glaciale]